MLFGLIEKTHGPHYGKVWRTEEMSRDEANSRNEKMQVMKWEPCLLASLKMDPTNFEPAYPLD